MCRDLITSGPVDFDSLGSELLVEDLTGDGNADLVVRIENRDVGIYDQAGVVFVRNGPVSGEADWLDAESTIEGDATNAWIGASLSADGDLDGDGKDDLVIGSPYHEVGSLNDAGIVT